MARVLHAPSRRDCDQPVQVHGLFPYWDWTMGRCPPLVQSPVSDPCLTAVSVQTPGTRTTRPSSTTLHLVSAAGVISLSSSTSSSSSSLLVMVTLKQKAINSGADDQGHPRRLPAIQESTTVSQLPLCLSKTAITLVLQSVKSTTSKSNLRTERWFGMYLAMCPRVGFWC